MGDGYTKFYITLEVKDIAELNQILDCNRDSKGDNLRIAVLPESTHRNKKYGDMISYRETPQLKVLSITTVYPKEANLDKGEVQK